MPATRRAPTRPVMIGAEVAGGGAPIAIQAMTSAPAAALREIDRLACSGCTLAQVTVSRAEHCDVLPSIVAGSVLPVIADVGVQSQHALAAIEAGCAAVRVNPGTLEDFAGTAAEIAMVAGATGTAVHLGITAGTLDWRLLAEYGRATPESLVESAAQACALFERHGFRDLMLSVHHTDPLVLVSAYRQLARRGDYPLHLEVAGEATTAVRRRQLGLVFDMLLKQGAVDSIRVSLPGSPIAEAQAAQRILSSLGVEAPHC